MYWNYPKISVQWPANESDPIVQSLHSGVHCLFWHANFDFSKCSTNQRLEQLCHWAQDGINEQGLENFLADSNNWDNIANLVKLNLWIHDIRQQGIVKPWLILDQGDGTYLTGVGDSRMKCLERIPEITTVPAFIACHQSRADLYQDLVPVVSFDQFAGLCNAKPKQLFIFTLTDVNAPYGMYWYEYDSERTRAVTPGQSSAVSMFVNYVQAHPDITITPAWFDSVIDWEHYKSNG